MSIVEDVRKILLAEITVNRSEASMGAHDDLLTDGTIDSLGIIKLIVALEKAYGVKINDEEVLPENFQSLSSIARFIELKTQRG